MTDHSELTREQLEDLMLSHAVSKALPGEEPGDALGRLTKERDPMLATLARQIDALPHDAVNKRALREDVLKLRASAEEMLDELVEKRRQPDETVASTYARLARQHDHQFVALYDQLARTDEAL